MNNPSHALTALKWYELAGVDEAVENTAVNRFALAKETAPKPVAPIMPKPAAATSVPAPAYASQGTAAIIAQAKAAAAACNTLDELREAVKAFEGCGLKKNATHTVFADGNPESPLMLVGEAPGAEEDKQGIPFCGESGQLLDKMLAAISRDRTNTYISNTVFWRPPGNRNPTPDEIETCRPFTERHIALVKPKLLVLVGGIATKGLLNTTQGITKLRTEKHSYQNEWLEAPLPTRAIFHPSYLIHQPAHKAYAWQDLLAIKQLLTELS